MLRQKLNTHKDRLLGRHREARPTDETRSRRQYSAHDEPGTASPPPQSQSSSGGGGGITAKGIEKALNLLPPKLKVTKASSDGHQQQQQSDESTSKSRLRPGNLTRLVNNASNDSIWGSPLDDEAVALGLVSPKSDGHGVAPPSVAGPSSSASAPRRALKPAASTMSLRGIFKLPRVNEEPSSPTSPSSPSYPPTTTHLSSPPSSLNLRVPGIEKQDSIGKRLSRRLSSGATPWRAHHRISAMSERSFSTFNLDDVQAALDLAPLPPPRPPRPPRPLSPLDTMPIVLGPALAPAPKPAAAAQGPRYQASQEVSPLGLRSVRSAQDLSKLKTSYVDARSPQRPPLAPDLPPQRRQYPPRPPAPTAPLPPTPPTPTLPRLPSLNQSCFEPLLPPTPVSPAHSLNSFGSPTNLLSWEQDEAVKRQREACAPLMSSPGRRRRQISPQAGSAVPIVPIVPAVPSSFVAPSNDSASPSATVCDDGEEDDDCGSSMAFFETSSTRDRLHTPATSVAPSSRPSQPPRSSQSLSHSVSSSSKGRSGDADCGADTQGGGATIASSPAVSKALPLKPRATTFAKPPRALATRPYRSVKTRPATPGTALTKKGSSAGKALKFAPPQPPPPRETLPPIPVKSQPPHGGLKAPATSASASRHKRGISAASRATARSRSNTHEWDPETKTIIGAYLASK